MVERIYNSVEELFKEEAPDLLEFLPEDDIFWKQIRENTITDEELIGHTALMQELGMYYPDSAVAKAVQLLKDARRSSLPTPLSFILPPK
jgi:hypothetical protein